MLWLVRKQARHCGQFNNEKESSHELYSEKKSCNEFNNEKNSSHEFNDGEREEFFLVLFGILDNRSEQLL